MLNPCGFAGEVFAFALRIEPKDIGTECPYDQVPLLIFTSGRNNPDPRRPRVRSEVRNELILVPLLDSPLGQAPVATFFRRQKKIQASRGQFIFHSYCSRAGCRPEPEELATSRRNPDQTRIICDELRAPSQHFFSATIAKS